MQLTLTGRNFEIGESLKTHVETTIQNTADHYFGDVLEVRTNLTKDHINFISDIAFHIGRHFIVHVSAQDPDAYRSFNSAMEKMRKRVKRYRDRLRKRERSPAHQAVPMNNMGMQYVVQNTDESFHEDDNPIIIAEVDYDIPTATVSDAVMQMDLTEQPVMMFQNAASGQLNVVFRREDGNVGWIDPRSSAPTLKSV